MCRFDEQDIYFRSPEGAISEDEQLRLRVQFRRGECEEVYIILKPDESDPVEYAMEWKGIQGSYDIFEATLPQLPPGLYWYHFRLIIGGSERYIDRRGLTGIVDPTFQLSVYSKNLKTPDWLKGGLIYHIFVDRFYRVEDKVFVKEGDIYREDWEGIPYYQPDENGITRNNDFFGGSLYGVIEKLPYLKDLGVSCLYLSPVFEAASSHKYDTGNYMKIDPAFGTEEIFEELCKKARDMGMRVILDGVFNHVGEDSIYFNKYGKYDSVGAYQSQDSPYYDWFYFDEWNEKYGCWWDIKLLPTVNKENKEFMEYLFGENGVLRYWIRKGLGGWRLDVVDELPDEFLNPLCDAIKAEDPDAIIIGEVWEDASNKIAYSKRRKYFQGGQLDSVMNYPLKNAIIEYLKTGEAYIVSDAMEELNRNYPQPVLHCLMNVLGTHDTARILTVLGANNLPTTRDEMAPFRLSEKQRQRGTNLLKIASLLQFTLPGVPCIYYGDEAGMEGMSDPFNRLGYPWGKEDLDIKSHYEKLSKIRRSLPAFIDGKYRLVCEHAGLFAFSRGEGDDTVFAGTNLTDVTVTLFEDRLYDHFAEKWVDKCTIPAGGWGLFSRKGI